MKKLTTLIEDIEIDGVIYEDQYDDVVMYLKQLEKAVEMAEFYADKNNWKRTDGWNNRHYAEYFEISEQDQSRISDGIFSGGYTAREFLLSIRETVADASTLADASGEMNKEGK